MHATRTLAMTNYTVWACLTVCNRYINCINYNH